MPTRSSSRTPGRRGLSRRLASTSAPRPVAGREQHRRGRRARSTLASARAPGAGADDGDALEGSCRRPRDSCVSRCTAGTCSELLGRRGAGRHAAWRGGPSRRERPARARRGVERVGEAEREALGAGPGDHGAVVGAQRRRRQHQRGAGLERDAAAAPCGSPRWRRRRRRRPARSACRGVRGTSAARRAARSATTSTTPAGTRRRGRDVGVGQRRDLLRLEPQRGLQAREREIGVGAPEHRPRQREARAGRRSSASRSTCGPPG